MRRRKKGPKKAEQWEEALKGKLTGEKAEYLRRGKLKKCDYPTLLKQIDACVIDNLNAALALFEEGSEDLVESLYRLEVLTDTVVNVYFFKSLGFIRQSDGEKIERRVKAAVSEFVNQIEIPVENENADLIYHVLALKSAAGLTA